MTPRAGSVCRVPEGAEQGFELSTTAMDVTDDVERSMLRPPIVPERLAIDARAGDIFVRAKDEDVPESFSVQIANRAPKLARLLTDDMRTEVPIQSCAVAVLTDSLGHIEDDCYRQDVVLACQRDKRLACLLLNIRRIDNGEPAACEPASGDEVQHTERV